MKSEIKMWVREYWNAKESLKYAEKYGYSVDVRNAFQRMIDAVDSLDREGLFKYRKSIPKLDEVQI